MSRSQGCPEQDKDGGLACLIQEGAGSWGHILVVIKLAEFCEGQFLS